ncbi:MAG TPA: hypothetical protein VFM51_11475 [Solirubrobacterales bacterium]|nr:hypothetical protein [Solirubrobacterales bacterium]
MRDESHEDSGRRRGCPAGPVARGPPDLGRRTALFNFAFEEIELKGVHEGTEEFNFEFATVKCNVASYLGLVKSKTTTASKMFLEPTYQECETNTGLEVEAKSEFCAWFFTSGNEEGGKFEGELDLDCLGDTDELIFIARSGGLARCTVGIPAQQGLKAITYTNKEAGGVDDLTIDVGVTNLAYSQTEGFGFQKCASGAETNGKYSAHPTVTAKEYKGSGAAVSLWIE